MPKKPTEDFGYIAFSKSGRVQKVMHRLPDDKPNQELSVGKLFAEQLSKQYDQQCHVEPIEERGHDFLLIFSDGKTVEVQATEIAAVEYLTLLNHDEYIEGKTGFQHFEMGANQQMFGIDVAKKENALVRQIQKKIDRHYAKPESRELWLLVWTVRSDFHFQHAADGALHLSDAGMGAVNYLVENGSGVFDQIWFFNLLLRPNCIWPVST